MSKIIRIFNPFIYFIFAWLIFVQPAYAGDVMEKGTVLKQQSYVFTIEEAKSLMLKLDTLEQELAKQTELLEQYQNLEGVLGRQNSNLKETIEIKELQITEYKSLHQIDLERIKKLERQNSISKYEKWGALTLGIGLSVGAILIADKIDDQIDVVKSDASTSRGVTLLKF